MIKDSGNRRVFETGAVRDMASGKGRCDLLPLDVVASVCYEDPVLKNIYKFVNEGYKNEDYLINALRMFCFNNSNKSNAVAQISDYIIECSIHFEEGANKYGENNWQKGLPLSCYIDSAVRHLLKYYRYDDDERHDRAFVWNILCCIWTLRHIKQVEQEDDLKDLY